MSGLQTQTTASLHRHPLLLHVAAIRTMAPGQLPFIKSQTATASNGDMRIPLRRRRRKKKSPKSIKPNSHFQNVLICPQWWKELSEAYVPSGCPLSATPSFKSLLHPPCPPPLPPNGQGLCCPGHPMPCALGQRWGGGQPPPGRSTALFGLPPLRDHERPHSRGCRLSVLS